MWGNLLLNYFLAGAFPYTIGRIEHGFNVRPDLCATENPFNPRKYLGQIYSDSLVHDEKALKYLTSILGEVGTDLSVVVIGLLT